MTRILTTLAALSLILLIATLTIGMNVGDLHHAPSTATLRLATIHRLFGIASALGVVFVESIVATYFIGTSRWCKEVTETYGLDPGRLRESNALKRRAFAVSLSGMLIVIGIITLGAASDPATGRPNTEAWTAYHLAAALGGLALIAASYYAAWQYVGRQSAIIQQIVGEVGKIRRERGLEPLTPAAK